MRFGLDKLEVDKPAAMEALSRYKGWPIAVTEALWLLRSGEAPEKLPADPGKLSEAILRACERHPAGAEALKLMRALVILEVPAPLAILASFLRQDPVEVRKLIKSPPAVGLVVVERDKFYTLFHNVLAEAVRQCIDDDEQWKPLHERAVTVLEKRLEVDANDEFALNRLPVHVRVIRGNEAFVDVVLQFADKRHSIGLARALREDLLQVADLTPVLRNPTLMAPPYDPRDRAMIFALLSVSVSSIASEMQPALIVELVKRHLWPISEALENARRIPSLRKRLKILTRLAATAMESQRASVLSDALGCRLIFSGKRLPRCNGGNERTCLDCRTRSPG